MLLLPQEHEEKSTARVLAVLATRAGRSQPRSLYHGLARYGNYMHTIRVAAFYFVLSFSPVQYPAPRSERRAIIIDPSSTRAEIDGDSLINGSASIYKPSALGCGLVFVFSFL